MCYINETSKYFLPDIIGMLNDYIENYITFQNNNMLLYENHVTFLFVNDRYHLFYNEKSKVNANDLPIYFTEDGKVITHNDIYFFVSFDESKKKQILEKLKKYTVSILNKKLRCIEFHRSNKNMELFGVYRKLFDSQGKYTFTNKYYGSHLENKIIKNKFNLLDLGSGNLHEHLLGAFTQEENIKPSGNSIDTIPSTSSYVGPSRNLIDTIPSTNSYVASGPSGIQIDTTVKDEKIKKNPSGIPIDEFEKEEKEQELSIDDLERGHEDKSPIDSQMQRNFTKTASDLILDEFCII